jgi:hypothetical protein
MRRTVMLIVLAAALIGAGVGIARLAFRRAPSSPADELKADSFRLERVYVVTVHIPNPEVEKVLEAVTAAVPLDYGFYDRVAYLDAPGFEQYRPREGSKGGASEKAGRTPNNAGLVLHPARRGGAREGACRRSPRPLLRGTGHLRPRGLAEPDHGPGREQPESLVESERAVEESGRGTRSSNRRAHRQRCTRSSDTFSGGL